MPIWNKTDTKPQHLTREQKRNLIVTDIGFVRRLKYTDVHGNSRVKDEIYNAISGLANSTNWGSSKITDLWHQPASPETDQIVNTFITFSEPIRANTTFRIVVANTAAGNNMIARTVNTTTYLANNTLMFKWVPSVAGTYKVQAQTLANAVAATGQLARSLNEQKETASLVINGVVSNTAGPIIVIEP